MTDMASAPSPHHVGAGLRTRNKTRSIKKKWLHRRSKIKSVSSREQVSSPQKERTVVRLLRPTYHRNSSNSHMSTIESRMSAPCKYLLRTVRRRSLAVWTKWPPHIMLPLCPSAPIFVTSTEHQQRHNDHVNWQATASNCSEQPTMANNDNDIARRRRHRTTNERTNERTNSDDDNDERTNERTNEKRRTNDKKTTTTLFSLKYPVLVLLKIGECF